MVFKNEFQTQQPAEGHQLRFIKKLENLQYEKKEKFNFWRPFSIAASFLILIYMGFTLLYQQPTQADLASVSPEMEQTQNFFTTTINNELANLKNEISPLTQTIIDDALLQMENLEKEYDNLKTDLVKSGNDKRVIYAMITNFQNRISLLENVLKQIEIIKELNTKKNENTIYISVLLFIVALLALGTQWGHERKIYQGKKNRKRVQCESRCYS